MQIKTAAAAFAIVLLSASAFAQGTPGINQGTTPPVQVEGANPGVRAPGTPGVNQGSTLTRQHYTTHKRPLHRCGVAGANTGTKTPAEIQAQRLAKCP